MSHGGGGFHGGGHHGGGHHGGGQVGGHHGSHHHRHDGGGFSGYNPGYSASHRAGRARRGGAFVWLLLLFGLVAVAALVLIVAR